MKLIIASENLPFRNEPPFPCSLPTNRITNGILLQIRDMLSASHELPFTVVMGKEQYRNLEDEKPKNLSFNLISGPSRADFYAGAWTAREFGASLWEEAQYEDLIFHDKALTAVAALRFKRVVQTSSTAYLTDQELLEQCHAMLKQLLEPKL